MGHQAAINTIANNDQAVGKIFAHQAAIDTIATNDQAVGKIFAHQAAIDTIAGDGRALTKLMENDDEALKAYLNRLDEEKLGDVIPSDVLTKLLRIGHQTVQELTKALGLALALPENWE